MSDAYPPAEYAFDVEVEVEGVRVTGHAVARHGRYMVVAIDSPWKGLTRGFSMPAFLPGVYCGTRAVEEAQKGLRQLFWTIRYLLQHREEIAEAMRAARAEAEYVERNHGDAPNRIAEDRRALRKMFKEGQLDQRSYQSRLALLRRRRFWFLDDREAAIKRCMARFHSDFSDCFGAFESFIKANPVEPEDAR